MNARVRIDSGEIFNVPDCWRLHLAPYIYTGAGVSEEVTKRIAGEWVIRPCRRFDPGLAGELSSTGKRVGNSTLWPIPDKAVSLLSSNKSHEQLLSQALGESSKFLVVASAFIRGDSIDGLLPEFREALGRGVTIVCLWGYSAEDATSEFEALSKLRSLEKEFQDSEGRLLFNKRRLNTHMKVVAWDSLAGFQCCIGSYNWLSTRRVLDASRPGENVSLILRDSRASAVILKAIVGVFAGKGRRERTAIPSILSGQAVQLEEECSAERVPDGESVCHVCILRDREHHQVFHGLIGSANENLLVMSHKVHDSYIRLFPLRRAGKSLSATVLCGEVVEPGIRAKIYELLSVTKSVFREKTKLHAKVIVSDHLSYIGSFNPLSADASERSKDSREVGVLIQSQRLSEEIWQLIEYGDVGGSTDTS